MYVCTYDVANIKLIFRKQIKTAVYLKNKLYL